ncbi:peptide deformylase [Neoehrlichia mikurensis]|uniref:Peptide deformylase n=1 Tax=Neoehrlichia mikurensis TaxID=89586 RepID=A0A9Q9BZK8_9RICK|nr:peptide deformylase [Neoehrlichia mikurensis]QXK92156.1 peptide deformylase [Neoehrlichia mikurensis]QXK92612.1 peptide deformylase [Neoehrlichia mikurensis]QXK93850.1 peptide deformylase [Neoehrlichia mikurensis]UTO55154.1 peptide deformylase [Neoehrlichia mikurensis]UTO56074.1 peptide deformylase [Neoehrlichia mikurensis]
MKILSVENVHELTVLHTKSDYIRHIDNDVIKLVDDMVKVVDSNRTVGFSAVQLGYNSRVFIINMVSGLFDVHKDIKILSGYHSLSGKNLICINPEIVNLSGETVTLFEGCLSAVSYGLVGISRPKHLDLKYTDLLGNECTIRAYRWLARCIQHEIDHLNGVLLANVIDNIRNVNVNSVSDEDYSTVHILLLNNKERATNA